MKFNRYISSVALALCGSLLLATGPAYAKFNGSDTLHIGAGAGSACATGGCFVYNGTEVNDVGAGNSVSIYENAGGLDVDATATQPLLLILAIPNQTTNFFASNPITNVTFYNPYPVPFNAGAGVAGSAFIPTAGVYGLNGPGTEDHSYFGSMTSGDIYSFLSLAEPNNNSNSFTNLQAADLAANSITATSFGIHVFAIKNDAAAASDRILSGKGLANITFNSGALPVGTFAVAYGFKGDFAGGSGRVFSTPFTQVGVTRVPEPQVLSLFVLALTGSMWHRRRRGILAA
jgi:hypothetical protein